MLNIPPLQPQCRPTIGAKTRDPEAQILVRITLRILNLTQELLSPIDLLQPALPRRVSRLLVFQLFHRGMAIHLAHPRVPFLAANRQLPGRATRSKPDHPVILTIALGIPRATKKFGLVTHSCPLVSAPLYVSGTKPL